MALQSVVLFTFLLKYFKSTTLSLLKYVNDLTLCQPCTPTVDEKLIAKAINWMFYQWDSVKRIQIPTREGFTGFSTQEAVTLCAKFNRWMTLSEQVDAGA